MEMFCYQCQETAKNAGCTVRGVCGKVPVEAKIEDLLIYLSKGISVCSSKLRHLGLKDTAVDYYIINSLFTTITNANFDTKKLYLMVENGVNLRDDLRIKCIEKNLEIEGFYEHLFEPKEVLLDFEKALEFAGENGVLRTRDVDRRSLVETVTYGLKGMAAYLEHAANLGYENEENIVFVEKALCDIENPNKNIEELVQLVLDTGMYGVKAMEILDRANTETYGHPVAGKANIGVGTNPGILISGHDLKDMERLLEQTSGTGVDVYTHSEMLPANYYPAFKKYEHFRGNYGGSWWSQDKEFPTFNGPILFTSNCIVPYPFREGAKKVNYIDKVFTTNAAGMEGCKHIELDEFGNKDFSEIITLAKQCEPPIEIEKGEVNGGFAHNQVLQLKDKIVDAVKSGAIKRFIVMGGCDGRMADRKYYTEFAEKLPKDTIILTAGCAKFRYLKLPLGDIGGIPRVLDAGQCNDSYSLVVIALALKEAFGLEDINDLPIVYNIAWYEQKAAIVLLALLYLGIKNIHIGPTLPAFLSPNIAEVLVDSFGLSGIGTVDEDLKKFNLV
ncbi:hydroxylamine reductase (plasmid) [Cetobacterium somerae]|uniref:hydroxylamine reductase n=1 Tax=Cetobacterium somerae TaxID=188913 RepID=UPI001F0675CE|nr:hydroxylamine reductase [Cetobacterium somerae]UPO99056.1 hydroxylamine reductase [Cetobacterium somerae]